MAGLLLPVRSSSSFSACSLSVSYVQNLRDAAAWLGYSYLFVRMLRAPGLYGVPIG
jgi:pre-mRNA-splicing helicase BRR2